LQYRVENISYKEKYIIMLMPLLQDFLDTWVYANAYFRKDEVVITLLAFPLRVLSPVRRNL